MTVRDFEREAEAMRPMLLHEACGYLGSTDDAEDAVQEALLKLWGMADTLRSPVVPLARVLVRNICVSRLRRRRPAVDVSEAALSVPAATENPDAMFSRVMQVIDTLPAAQQVVLRLRHIDGMTFADIARLTGSSEAAVRQALSRARIAVRRHFTNGFDDEE